MAGVDPRNDPAGFIYTGGTTGLSKGAMLSHFNLVSNTMQSAAWFPGLRDGREAIMCVLPFFHSYGMTVCMNLGIYKGAKLVLLPRFDLGMTLKAIQKERPTMFPGVPRLYIALNEADETKGYDLSSIQACLSGAAPLPLAVAKKFDSITGASVVEGYGRTRIPWPAGPGKGPSASPSRTRIASWWTWTIRARRSGRAMRESCASPAPRSCWGTGTARTRPTR